MKKLVFCLSLCGLFWTGCTREPKETLDEGRIEILFTANTQASLLKSTPTTAENNVTEIMLIGVDGSGNVVTGGCTPASLTGADLTAALTVLGTSITVSKRVVTLYAIANPSSSLRTSANSLTTLSGLQGLTNSFAAPMPASPFMMSGTGTVNHTAKTVAIELIRAVAKIDIRSGTTGFVITSASVQSTPDLGYVFGRTPLVIPTSGMTRVNYGAVTSANPILYAAESPGSASGTSFNVTGSYDEKTATYNFRLTKLTSYIDIVRNTHYVVNINPVTEATCTITITIADWNDETSLDPIEIPYENFN